MSESNRARERLDFEAAAEVIEKSRCNTQISTPSTDHAKDLLGFGEDRFVSSSFIEVNRPTFHHGSIMVQISWFKLFVCYEK
jgi:hypothetical protein